MLEDQEGMLHLGTDTRLAPVNFLVGIGQRCIPVRPLVDEPAD